MMAAAQPTAKDPLDTLQLLVNEALIQVGKALRLSSKDSQGNLPVAPGSLQPKLPETIKAYHTVLDELENDIVRAKSVFLRDLNELQSQKALAKPPDQHFAESRPKSPTMIYLNSPPSLMSTEHSVKTESTAKPIAPFPDMGMSLLDTTQPSMVLRDENLPTQAPPSLEGDGMNEDETHCSPTAATSVTDQKLSADQHAAENDGEDTLALNSRLNFPEMEFTFPPTHVEPQEQPHDDALNANTTESTFDLSSFVPTQATDTGNSSGLTHLNSIIPANLGDSNSASSNADDHSKTHDDRNNDLANSAFADIFTGDGQADGMDFDFSIGDGGMGGNTFDDLMNDRDNKFNTIEQGDFDETFFSLDKTEAA